MAMESYLLRFRAKTTEELLELQAQLEAQQSVFSQQSMGSKGFTRDLRRLDDQLNAIAYVLRERGPLEPIPPPINIYEGITDFSQLND